MQEAFLVETEAFEISTEARQDRGMATSLL